MSPTQKRLPLDSNAGPAEPVEPGDPDDVAADTVAWIESDRGRPHHAKRIPQAGAIERLFGRAFIATIPSDDEWRDSVHADDRQRVVEALAAARAGGSFDATYRIVLPDGTSRVVRDRVLSLGDRWQLRLIVEPAAAPPADDDATPEPVGTWLDAALDEAIVRVDHAGRISEVHGAHEMLPVPAMALIGRRVSEIDRLPLPMRVSWDVALDRCLDTRHPQITAYVLDRDDGPRSYEARMMPVGGAAVIAVRDVGERDALRARVEAFAMQDIATGLGNMRALRERLDAWLRHGVDVAALPSVALLVIDIDRFKQANDLHGRSVGDSLLRLVAQRIHREALGEVLGRAFDANATHASLAIDPADDAASVANLTVVRLGGDQFAVAWRIDGASSGEGGDPGERALTLAHRLVVALGTPTRIAGQNLFVRASIGIAIYPVDAMEASTLLSQAEGALKRAKQAGRNLYRRHGDDANGADSAPASAMPPNNEAAMRAGLASGQFLLVYQPKFELASSLTSVEPGSEPGEATALVPGAMVAVEALVRWRTPAGTLLVPHDFIPLAEASGMIRPLGDWVLRTALAEVARFEAQGAARVGVAVNVSLLQLHDRAFVDTVTSALREYGFAPHELTLEIAETALLDDVRLVADVVAELSALGVRLAIDHFGIGTAGLVALKSLPVDEIKIDRSFIAGSAIDAFDATIVSGLIEMAHNLGKTVTADGVERVDQIAALAQMRCDAIQGYFIGEPMTASEIVAVQSLWRKSPRPTST